MLFSSVVFWGLSGLIYFKSAVLPAEASVLLLPLSLIDVLVLYVIFLFFGLMPDVDTSSKIQNFVYGGLFFILAGLILSKRYFEASLIGILSTIPIMVSHRGVIHSPIVGLLFALPLLYFGKLFFIAGLAGFLSHLIADRI